MVREQMLYPRESSTRRVVSLDGMWKFQLDPRGEGISQGYVNGLPSPDSIPVPASFQDFYTDKNIREYAGDFWYETDVFVPGEWKGSQVCIRFGCATHRAVVYVNGEEITANDGGFLPFGADITEIAKYNAYNKVLVKLNNELNVTTLPCGETKILSDGRKMAKPYFDFFNYAGLNRPVKLISYPKNCICDYTVSFERKGKDAFVHYQTRKKGGGEIIVQLLDAQRKLVETTRGDSGTLCVPDAHLWQIRNAYLYRIVIRLMEGETLVDEYWDEIGIRTVEIKGEEFLLNGKPVYFKGFGKHEDSDIVGRGYNPGVMKRDFACMEWIGANAFRTAHYPYSEEIYQMADREGFLVIDEAPAVGLFASLMNFMEASTGKQSAFFTKETTPQLLAHHLKTIEEMITRDKNHACVIAWSLLNEPETTDESAVPYFKEVFEKAKELDIQKRPCTFALIMNSLPDTCKCYQFADFICLNRYYGWYVSGGYEITDAEVLFRKELDSWRDKKLDKPFFFTEYGADTYAAEHKLPSVMWSQEYQEEYLSMCHRVFDSYGFIKGEMVWNFADFQTTEGILRVNGNRKGIFTRQRQPKDAAYLLKKRWESLPEDFKAKQEDIK